MRYTTPLILAAALACTLPLAGCQLFGQDKVPAPKDSPNYAPGTPITLPQFEAEIEAKKAADDAAFEKEQRAALRQIDRIERQAQSASVEAINAAKDQAAEIADELDAKVQDRASAIKAMQVSLAQHRADIEARRSQFETILTTAQGAVSTGLIPGGSLVGIGLGLVGTLFGLGQRAKAQRTEANATRIVDAIDIAKEKDPAFAAAFKSNAKTIQDFAGPEATALVSKIQHTYN